MNKKAVIAIIVVILLLIAGYFIFANKAKAPTTSPITTVEQTSSPTSLKDLLSKGIAQSCTFSSVNSNGTVYVNGGKVRTDFVTTVDGKTTKSHMIVDGNTSYIWTDGSTSGFKMTVDTSAIPGATASSTGSFDTNANMDYKCSPWVADSSLFTLPTDIKFMSFGSVTAPVGSSAPTTGSNASQCSYCDSLSGDSKTQCLTALKCN